MDQAMHSYYKYSYVPDVLQARVAAIRSVMPRQTRLLDLGCNDGTISLSLIKSGHAAASTGIDFEDLRGERLPEFDFIAADLRHFDVETLPPVDAILCLNLVHHLCLHGVDFTRQFLRALSTKAGVVFLDMGSLGAQIDPRLDSRWLQALRSTWHSDEECWADLFTPFAWRRALLTYPFQNGRRVLWKLTTEREPAYEFFTPEQVPAGTVQRQGTEELFWVKSHGSEDFHARQPLLDFLRTVPFDTILPMTTEPGFGSLYAYDPELAGATGLSFTECLQAFSPAEFSLVRQFSTQPVPAFDNRPLGLVCDFRVLKTSRGLTFFHFEPGFSKPHPPVAKPG